MSATTWYNGASDTYARIDDETGEVLERWNGEEATRRYWRAMQAAFSTVVEEDVAKEMIPDPP